MCIALKQVHQNTASLAIFDARVGALLSFCKFWCLSNTLCTDLSLLLSISEELRVVYEFSGIDIHVGDMDDGGGDAIWLTWLRGNV